jgi:hypothetical protein
VSPSVFRGLRRLLKPRNAEESEIAAPFIFPETVETVGREPHPLVAFVDAMEKTAVTVYAAHGLPDQTGHYGRSPRDRQWRFIGQYLNANERWALALANPGWRFTSLEYLGDAEGADPALKTAARLLQGCTRIRAGLASGGWSKAEADRLEEAVRLGMIWQDIQNAELRINFTPLKLTAPAKIRKNQPRR